MITVVAVVTVVVLRHRDGAPELKFSGYRTDVPGVTAVNELTGLVPGNLPHVDVAGDVVVVHSDRDFSVGWKSARFAVSEDGGATFRRLRAEGPISELDSISVVILHRAIVVVGSKCSDPGPPDPGNVEPDLPPCREDLLDAPKEAFLIGLAHDTVTRLPSPPERPVSRLRALGPVAGHATFLVTSAPGSRLLTWNDGWTSRDLPVTTSTACAATDRVVAVWSVLATDTTTSTPVRPRTPRWAASVTTDLGESWSEPSIFTSKAEHDVPPTRPHLACGPGGLLVLSGQLAAFDYAHRSWKRIDLPDAVEGSLPEAAVAWPDDADVRLWMVRTARSVDISDPFGPTPRVTVGDPVDATVNDINSTFGGGAPANRFVVLRTATAAYLGRAAG
ncbi:MAG: hypothetical protein JO291_02835 [Acidimicrobiia bacterium]|nr:hypothetical protein [Acidimicrobiia bacterium]